MTDAIKFKKCPFCGSNDIATWEGDPPTNQDGRGRRSTDYMVHPGVGCLTCGAKINRTNDSERGGKPAAIEAWQRRVA